MSPQSFLYVSKEIQQEGDRSPLHRARKRKGLDPTSTAMGWTRPGLLHPGAQSPAQLCLTCGSLGAVIYSAAALCSAPRCSGGSCCSSLQSTTYLSSPASSAEQSSSRRQDHHPRRLLHPSPSGRRCSSNIWRSGLQHGVPGVHTLPFSMDVVPATLGAFPSEAQHGWLSLLPAGHGSKAIKRQKVTAFLEHLLFFCWRLYEPEWREVNVSCLAASCLQPTHARDRVDFSWASFGKKKKNSVKSYPF